MWRTSGASSAPGVRRTLAPPRLKPIPNPDVRLKDDVMLPQMAEPYTLSTAEVTARSMQTTER